IAVVCRCFNWAVEEELIPYSPIGSLRLRLPTKPRDPMTAAQYVLLMRSGTRVLRRALFFLRRTGARTIEMRQLRWGHINWDAGVAVFSEHKTTRLNGLPRTIALEPGVLRFLRNLQRQRVAENEHVFLNSDNEPWTRRALNKHFRYYAKQLGLGGVSPYGL